MNHPDWLLLTVAASAPPDALRRVACASCRRIFETRPRLFKRFAYRPDGEPDAWSVDTLLAAIAGVETPDGPDARSTRIGPEQLAAAATFCYRRWEWANQQAGGPAYRGDYEDAFVTWKSVAAVAACHAADIRTSLGECLRCAADAIAFHWKPAKWQAAMTAERATQADLIRTLTAPGAHQPAACPSLRWSDPAR